ncbi:MAG TPA: MarR family transcriptional regulator [Thermoanaerobaculia bacterium]|nr:MarR family transcriptional regulator [Thermoanaerobaculia bacterium]
MARRSRLLDELRQRRPFPSPADEALVSLLRTTDVVRRHLAATLEQSGVTPQQYNVLRILRGAGEEGLPTLEIADRMIEQTPGITRLLDRLEAKGLVRRQRCGHDRRQVLCWLTAAGGELLADLDAPLVARAKELFVDIEPRETATLLALLERLRAAADGRGAADE